MNKQLFLLGLLASFSVLTGMAQTISIATDHTQLVLKVGDAKRLYQTYLGERLSEGTDLSRMDSELEKLAEGI